ncbi:MAG: ABC transporter substrate-binding protein [Tissierella sp.]|nr:ABC transporter substrate-binding protein [Tissierella sp.]
MKMKKLVLLLLSLVLVMGVFTACSSPKVEDVDTPVIEGEDNNQADNETAEPVAEYGVTINEDTVSFVDGRGQEVTIDKNPQRVVVLYNSFLEVWMANGGSVVGKLEPSVGQEEIQGVEDAEIIGKLGAISVEKVISVEPDLIILNSTQKSQLELIPAFEENNIPVIGIDYVGLDDYLTMTRLFTALNGREDLFKSNALDVVEEIDDILATIPEEKEHKVLLIMASAKSVTARDSTSYVGMMLEDLNTINIADESGGALSSQNFSMEKILEEDPDFIFVQTTGSDMDATLDRLKEDAESNPAWASLSAVQNDRYIILPKDMYMFKANQRYAEAYENLAEIIYPELFQ